MPDGFALLLRRYRLNRRLTQERLAELAAISSRSVGEIERGRGRSPRPQTVEQLATALELTGAEREEFVASGQALFWASRDGRPGRRVRRTPGAPAAPARLNASVPRQLPADFPDFVGREKELATLCDLLGQTTDSLRLIAISGPPGVGKTALAVHTSHLLAGRFADGQLFAALRGATGQPADPAEVLGQLLRALGVDGAALPVGVDARAGLFRLRLAGRRVLVVLDDASGHHQVEPLLPGENAAVVITSRLPLTGIPGVATLDLRPLPLQSAVDLLRRVAGGQRIGAEPAAATQLVTACGGLPLAVRIAAARLAAHPHWTVSTLTERLADERRRLDELCHGDLAVRPGLRLSYQTLVPPAARAFALLGALPVTSFPEWAVGTLADLPPVAGAAALDNLLDARLLDDLGPDSAGQRRYQFHEVTRLYARECRDAEVSQADWIAALGRAATGWLALARRAQDGLHCDRCYLDDRSHPAAIPDERAGDIATARAVEWFEAEREALAVLIPACAQAGLVTTAWALAGCCADFYQLRGYHDDWRAAMRVALDACRHASDRSGEVAMLSGLGHCMVDGDDHEEALSVLRAARLLAGKAGGATHAATLRAKIGYTLALTGRLVEAEAELRAAAEELRRAGLHDGRSVALTSLGFVLREQGDTSGAIEAVRGARDIARNRGGEFAQAYASRGLAGALRAAGHFRQAAREAQKAAAMFERIGDPIGAGQSLRTMGEALARDPHMPAQAERALAAAAGIFRERGFTWGLALTDLSLGEIQIRRGNTSAVDALRRCLRYWTEMQVPALRARTLVALAAAAEHDGDPAARGLLLAAHEIYQELNSPAALALAVRLGLPSDGCAGETGPAIRPMTEGNASRSSA